MLHNTAIFMLGIVHHLPSCDALIINTNNSINNIPIIGSSQYNCLDHMILKFVWVGRLKAIGRLTAIGSYRQANTAIGRLTQL